jgi:hypothetical protein
MLRRREDRRDRDRRQEQPSCPLCSKSYGRQSFGNPSPDLCDRCYFLNEVVEHCVQNSILRRRGDKQEYGWKEDWYSSSSEGGFTARWSNISWTIWNNRIGESSEFEIYTVPGKCLIVSPVSWLSSWRLSSTGVPKPFPDIPTKSNYDLTDSDISLATARQWLETCRTSHHCLSDKPTTLPKRVLDVSSSTVKLVETDQTLGQYACLSHCWGKQKPTCRTLMSTLEANKQGIPWNPMPATFQDAIDFTRRLGLQYIWIDSLCIIQDSDEDWVEQSALMADIYGNAYVTLCATASHSDDGGCYRHTPNHLIPRKITARDRSGREFQVYVRDHIQLRHIPPWYRATEGSNPQLFPLMTRAWTYQERLLSPRLIHFAAGELMFECSMLSACECHRNGYGGNSTFMHHHAEKKAFQKAMESRDPKVLLRLWNDIVFSYSGLSLTYGKDKFPALSGVAKRMLAVRGGDDVYLAGLWKSTLLNDLRWHRFHEQSRRPTTWTAPSWSWASLSVVVQYHATQSDDGVIDYCAVIDASVTLDTSDPTGRISAGHIVLSGPVVYATVDETAEYKYEFQRYTLQGEGLSVKFSVDCYGDFHSQPRRLTPGDQLCCLRLGKSHSKNDYCLVLKPQPQEDDQDGHATFIRVGHIIHSREDLEKHWYRPGLGMTTVRII